jgi:hypothetical protein
MPASHAAASLVDSAFDEEALARNLPQSTRRAKGIYFSPAPLVDAVVALASEWVAPRGAVSVIDPACGAGAFLAGARRAWPKAMLFGADISDAALQPCRERLSDARLVEGNSLTQEVEALWPALRKPSFEVWLGNPPFQGRSDLLDDPARLKLLLPAGLRMPKGTSLRDDYALFLLRAAERLREREGLLAYVTPSSLLDSYAYGPVREYLLSTLTLRHVVDLGRHVFADARVATCVTFFSSPHRRVKARYQSRETLEGPFAREQLTAPLPVEPEAPQWVLRPKATSAEALDAKWREQGEPLDVLVPISLTGLKTRFEELWVASSREDLEERVRAFLGASSSQLADFAHAHAMSPAKVKKLRALKALDASVKFAAENIWPFVGLSAPRAGSSLPVRDDGYCYLERRLIPRGDHRFRGLWNPHACPTKLVFNARERPLFAFVLEERACVPAFQHTRFAPLLVPRVLRDGGLRSVGKQAELDDEGPNLSPPGLEWAQGLGGPARAFERIAAFIASDEVQQVWAPAFATTRVLPIPYRSL